MNFELTLLILVLYAVFNLISFCLFGIDKMKAVKNRYRISESALLASGLLGPFGALAGMEVFRHKTRKPKFKLIYVFVFLHLVLMYLIFFYFEV